MKILILFTLFLNVSCSSLGYHAARSVIDIATAPKDTKQVIENRTVIENREVKVVHINVKQKEDLKHSEDVQLGQKRVFFYPNP
jgi:hypothetical protein